MAGSRERERRRARERYERQQEIQLARRRKLRKRFGIGLAVVCVLGLIGGLTAVFATGGTPTAAKKPKATASAVSFGVCLGFRDHVGRRRCRARDPLHVHDERGGTGRQEGVRAADRA